VEWDARVDGTATFDVKLVLTVQDRQGLLAKIVSAIADMKANIKNVEATTAEGSNAHIRVILVVKDQAHMNRVISGISRIQGVLDVIRARR
jgi:guanosine-3',5'-bis(diphosphate) 3'-pyrophosphohydrolase